MSRIFSARLSETWLKAAVVGSLWASFEIIIGSFLHNMRMPFAGTILSFASVGMVIAFIQVWKNRGLVWRAGLIAALLKSISPSAIIIGPMVGIFSEAIIIEVVIIMLGRNLPSYLIAGAFAVLSALIHKVVSLLITYGFDLVIIVKQLYLYLIRKIGLTEGDPYLVIICVAAAYMFIGMTGALLGFLGGVKAREKMPQEFEQIIPESKSTFFKQTKLERSSPWFLLLHLIGIMACLYMINVFPLWISLIPALSYTAFCLYKYRSGMRSFRKPSFWIWFFAITLLAAIFWNGFSTGKIWDTEGLIVGLKMNLRAMVILTGFAAISKELHNPIIRTVLYHHGFANVYHAVGLAFSVLPGIINSLPGPKKLISKPVTSLGMIVARATEVYPVLNNELKKYCKIIIVSGEIEEGKTTFLLKLIPLLKDKGLRLKGFVAKGIHDKDRRIGYDLEDLDNGNSIPFIRKTVAKDTFRHGKYYFSEKGIEFGNRIFDSIGSSNTDLFIIDEVGPVELKGKGWSAGIEELIHNNCIPQMWVVRKSLVKKVIRQWNIGDVMLINIAEDKHNELVKDICTFLKKEK